jgi:hypothetical protein
MKKNVFSNEILLISDNSCLIDLTKKFIRKQKSIKLTSIGNGELINYSEPYSVVLLTIDKSTNIDAIERNIRNVKTANNETVVTLITSDESIVYNDFVTRNDIDDILLFPCSDVVFCCRLLVNLARYKRSKSIRVDVDSLRRKYSLQLNKVKIAIDNLNSAI